MTFYSNPAQDPYLRERIKTRQGVSRLYKTLQHKHKSHGKTTVLSAILLVAKEEGVLFARRSILRVMNENNFTRQEKNAMVNWIDDVAHGGKYVYCRDERTLLTQEQQKKVSKEGAEVTSAQNAK